MFSVENLTSLGVSIGAGMDFGSALSVENVARFDKLTVRTLRTKSFGLTVTAVLGGADALLMSK